MMMEIETKKTIKKVAVLVGVIVAFILINVTRQYYKKVFFEYSSGNEYVRTIDCAQIFDEYPQSVFILRFELRSDTPGEVKVYQLKGTEAKYNFCSYVYASEDFRLFEIEVTPELTNKNVNHSYLSFYGGENTGVKPIVRNISVEVKK